jgi:uncharacterized protein
MNVEEGRSNLRSAQANDPLLIILSKIHDEQVKQIPELTLDKLAPSVNIA